MDKEIALKQLKEIEKLAKEIRLAADGWDEHWKTLVATLLSARTTDKITIPIAQRLFDKYGSVEKLSKASVDEIASIIRGVNFYKTKSRNVSALAVQLMKDYSGKVPVDFDKLVELPGVGRKTANVFLAEYGHGTIGIDTHVTYISQYLGWTENDTQEKIEGDLKKIFPENLWGRINWILVRFGQSYPNRRIKNELLDKIKEMK